MSEPSSDAQRPVVFDRAAEYYDATRGFPPGVESRVAALLAETGRLGSASRVLELGVGTGRIALPLATHVRDVVGIDLSAPMLAKLIEKAPSAPVRAVRADAAALPFAAASFDAVVGVHVFHLITRWRDVLGEVARVLRPGGVLLHAADDQASAGVIGFSPHRLAAKLGHENRGVPRDRYETFPEDEGWRLARPVERIAFARTTSPEQVLERMASRRWSATWGLSDEQLAGAIAELRAELLAKFGALDRTVEIETGFWARAYEPPKT
jgi:ubiquinone/menaquinone biosynthesis C-methylase UbiE